MMTTIPAIRFGKAYADDVQTYGQGALLVQNNPTEGNPQRAYRITSDVALQNGRQQIKQDILRLIERGLSPDDLNKLEAFRKAFSGGKPIEPISDISDPAPGTILYQDVIAKIDVYESTDGHHFVLVETGTEVLPFGFVEDKLSSLSNPPTVRYSQGALDLYVPADAETDEFEKYELSEDGTRLSLVG